MGVKIFFTIFDLVLCNSLVFSAYRTQTFAILYELPVAHYLP